MSDEEGFSEVITTIKRNISMIALIIVIALLIVSFTINDDVHTSTTLDTTQTTTTDSSSREVQTTSYVDKDGHIQFATDKGYAPVRKTYDDGKVVLEEYQDAKGKPVLLSAGSR